MTASAERIRLVTFVWPLFLAARVFMSNVYELIQLVSVEGIVRVPLLVYDPWLWIIQVAACLAAVLFAFRIRPAVTGGLFLSGFLYLCWLIYAASGSYGQWAFYTCPLLVLVVYNARAHRERPDTWYRLLVAAYVLFYASAGIAKIFPFDHGWKWLHGHTVENLLLARRPGSILYEWAGIDIGTFPWWLLKSGVVLSVALELATLLLLVDLRWARSIVPAIVLFHAVLYVTGTTGLPEYAVAALLFTPAPIARRTAAFLQRVDRRFAKSVGSLATVPGP